MEILDPALQQYLDAHCDPEPEALQKINRDTHVQVLQPHMLSGHYQGRVLSMLSKLVRPKHILEIGTFTGYATICLAEGLVEGGKIDTVEVKPELENRLFNNFQLAGLTDKISLHIGNAAEIIFGFSDNYFDLAFIDADKKSNLAYYQAVIQKTKPGGVVIIDNVLWKGKVYGPENDAQTETFRKLNSQITVDPRVEKFILPVRDGLLVIRKL
ncbi:O-methyltransferase [Mucilaginibacter koreensis]